MVKARCELLHARRVLLQQLVGLAHTFLQRAELVAPCGFRIVQQRARSAALDVGHHQAPCFARAVAPLRDVVAAQSVAGALPAVGRQGRELALAAHAFLAVLIRVVQVGEVGHDAYQAADGSYQRGLAKAGQRVGAYGLYQIAHHDAEHDEQKVIRHLQVIGEYLESRKQSRYGAAPKQLAAVAEHQAGNGGGDEGQSEHLPDMACGDDDEQV